MCGIDEDAHTVIQSHSTEFSGQFLEKSGQFLEKKLLSWRLPIPVVNNI